MFDTVLIANRFATIWSRAIFAAVAIPMFVVSPMVIRGLFRAGVSFTGLAILIYLALVGGVTAVAW